MRWSIWLGGAILLAACGTSTPDGGRDAAATGGQLDAKAATGGRTGTGGALRLDAATAGGMGGAGGADAGPSTLACREEGATCEFANDCCAGSSCVGTSTEPGGYRCKRNCTADSECQTGCCAAVGLPSSVCLDRLFCPSSVCHKEEEACQDDFTCCGGLACAVFDAQTSACKPTCTQNADCQSGCCVPLGTIDVSVCLDAVYCRTATCHPAEEACAADGTCCDGLTCIVFSTNPVTSACKPTCTKNQDCPTGCCALLASGSPGACLEKSYCSGAR